MADTSTQRPSERGPSQKRPSERAQLGAAPADAEAPAETAGDIRHATRGGRLGWLTGAPSRLRRTVAAHWQFSLVVLAATCIRIVIILGYPPIMWFNDSFNYFNDAVTHIPDNVRPNGYPFFLSVFVIPLHSVYPVAVVQAMMGLAMGILIYALLRRRGLPWWGAALAAVPVLFDVFEMQLEHMVTADSLFTFLVTLAVVICCWKDRPSVTAMAIAGLLIGYATIVRSVGTPLLVVFIVAMLVRRAGWRRLAVLVVAGIVPIAAYAGWFHHTSGKYALSESGAFLYSRVSTFALCSKMNPPADLRKLCDPAPPADRPPSQEYVWADTEQPPLQKQWTPLYAMLKANVSERFTPYVSGLSQKFAERAILAQPVDYVEVVFKDTVHTFGWFRQPDPDNYYGNGSEFRFSDTVTPVPWWASRTQADANANLQSTDLHKYLGGSVGQPKVVHPWAGFVQWYQRYFYFHGTLLGLALLIGAIGVLARWRRLGGLPLLSWLVGALLIVLPPMTAGFSYRYVVAAVPVTCLAAGLAFAKGQGDQSVRAWAAELGRYFGRGVPVKQE